MMKWISFLLVGIAMFSCTGVSGNKTEIGGTFFQPGAKLVLYRVMAKEPAAVDSTYVLEGGKFSFELRLTEPTFFLLRYTAQKEIVLLIEPGEQVKLDINDSPKWLKYSVNGSLGSEQIKVVSDSLNHTLNLLDSMKVKFETLSKMQVNQDSLRHVFMDTVRYIVQRHRAFTRNFVRKNTQSLAVIVALNQQFDPRTFVLNSKEDFQLFRLADSTLYIKYPNNDLVSVLHQNVSNFEQQQALFAEARNMPSLGTIALDFSMATPQGDTLSLKSLRGKYVLLDFWASWCPPCRKESPNLVKAYQKYHTLGFEILQVSIDKNRAPWIKAIAEDKLSWHQVGDLKFWDSPVARLYHITRIPANFLIDPNGKIIARDVRGEELEKTLSRIFEKK
ncbi:MAG TPA: TlpA disulfide reductase family protein [Williamwhitmania sp.]|nr:TlpA disulfide reductase family protein [Williamwhitmania sp.]